MVEKKDRIVNISIVNKTDCTAAEIDVISKYWKLNEDLDFVYKSRSLIPEAKSIGIKLPPLIRTKSSLNFYVYCGNCQSYEHNSATSQNNFKQSLSIFSPATHRRNPQSYKCVHCCKTEQQEQENLRRKEQQEYLDKFRRALEERAWEQLGNFDREVLGNCLKYDIAEVKQIYWGKMGAAGYKKLFRAIKKLGKIHLLQVLYFDGHKVRDYRYLPELKEEFEHEESNSNNSDIVEATYQQEYNSSNVTDQVKFRLTLDDERRYPDGPMYSGTVNFKRRIIIEPGVEYSFAQWKRSNEDLFLVLTPISELDLRPSQRRMSDLPTPLKQAIRDFYDAFDIDEHF